jgi:ribosome recycling factor
MSPEQLINKVPDKLRVAVEHFQDELKRVRTGRAHPSMLDGILVSAYGTQLPLNQAASVTTPEGQLLQITPFDPNNLQAIVSAIRDNQALGLNPTDDGHVVRVPIPQLTEERRHELTKLIGQKQEECMITLRNIRHEAINLLNESKKDKQIGEDEATRLERQVDEAMNRARLEAETAAKTKEQEIINF